MKYWCQNLVRHSNWHHVSENLGTRANDDNHFQCWFQWPLCPPICESKVETYWKCNELVVKMLLRQYFSRVSGMVLIGGEWPHSQLGWRTVLGSMVGTGARVSGSMAGSECRGVGGASLLLSSGVHFLEVRRYRVSPIYSGWRWAHGSNCSSPSPFGSNHHIIKSGDPPNIC